MPETPARRFDRRTLLARGGLAGTSALAGAGAYAAAGELADGDGAGQAPAGGSLAASNERLFLLDSPT